MSQTSTSLGLRQATLALRPHDPNWVTMFESEAARIHGKLADFAFEIAHIGSTAVPKLPAKAILDIAMRARETDHSLIAKVLIGLGYIDRGIRSGRLFIRLRDGDVRTRAAKAEACRSLWGCRAKKLYRWQNRLRAYCR